MIPSLVATIRHIFEVWRRANVVIAATIRNAETFAAFESACSKSSLMWICAYLDLTFAGSNHFVVSEVAFNIIPAAKQTHLFYQSTVPIRILNIRDCAARNDPFKPD